MSELGLHLDQYPWDTLAPLKDRASSHPEGLADLSIGTPVDPTPEPVRKALAAGSDSHGYPTTAGTAELREAIASWCCHWRGVDVEPATEVMPTVGSKELVAWLPTLLGLRQRGLSVAAPSLAYPTYDMGATIAGVESKRLDAVDIAAGASLDGVGLLWVNSPSNPTGEVLDTQLLAQVVIRARQAGVVVASDECYALLSWEADEATARGAVASILDSRVSAGSHEGLLSVYSLSKQSNLAGYRAAFATGDSGLISDLTNSRRHAGMIVPGPIQTAMIAALRDSAHVEAQRDIYARRRDILKPALESWGARIDHSEAGLYLWITRDEDCWTTLEALAELGILAGPGMIYGTAGERHVRVALTATDETISSAARRLHG